MQMKEKKTSVFEIESIPKAVAVLAIPSVLSMLVTVLYNMVDTWVVGNFVSNEAFSAVGTVGPIINMLIGFFMGLSSGAGVVISQYYGAHKPDRVRDTVHTAMVLTLVAFFGYMAFMGYAVMWYYVAAAVVVGFAVAYAAMFGFDKLKEALGQIKKNNE